MMHRPYQKNKAAITIFSYSEHEFNIVGKDNGGANFRFDGFY